MRNLVKRSLVALAVSTVALACGGDDGGDGDGDGDGDIPELTLSGTIVDFETADPLGAGTVTVDDGLVPPPTVAVTGGDFEIAPIPPFSVFHLLASSPPSHRATYNRAIVDEADVADLQAAVISEDFIAALELEFGVAPGTAGLLVAQIVDESGAGVAGIAAETFVLNNAAPIAGPFFLDEQRQPDVDLVATSTSGFVVFFELEPGLVAVEAASGFGITLDMDVAPAADNTATVAVIDVTEGELVIPTGLSFADDIVPIFEARGCDICHSGNGIGRDLGNLTLDASVNLIYRETTEELSPAIGMPRVNTDEPEISLLLTLPSAEDPPDRHPNVTFASGADPDYLKILGWITDGAPEN
jgi:hypothetical protein